MMNSDLIPLIREYLGVLCPTTLLVIGQSAAANAIDYQAVLPASRIHACVQSAELPDQHFDAALVLDCIEHLDKSTGMHLIARLRDTVAAHLLLAVPLGQGGAAFASVWQDADFIALGMQVHAHLQTSAGVLGFYHFAIHDYKPVPDWLNAQYWAHPERWEP
jgi:hypothetical protein